MKMERVSPCWHWTFWKKGAAKRRQQQRVTKHFESLEKRVMLSSVVPGGEPESLSIAQAADASGINLRIAQTSDTTNVTQGNVARYAVTVENVGSENVTAAQVEDRLLHFMSEVSWTATTTGGATANLYGQGDIQESVDLPIGSSVVYLIEGTIRKDQFNLATNSATVNASSGTDVDPSDNRASINQVVNLYSEPNGVELIAGRQILGPENGIDVELGDLDGDGDLDAIFVNGPRPYGNSEIETFAEVWFHVGSGKFIKQYEIQVDATEVTLGDLDADGDLDLFFANAKEYDDTYQAIWINDGTGHFAQSNQPFLNLHTSDVQLGDLDGDGDLDAMVLGRQGETSLQNEIQVWLNNGTGPFQLYSTLTPGSKYEDDGDIHLGDIDGDGDLDAFVSGGTGAGESTSGRWTLNWVLRNDGAGAFSILETYNPPIRFFTTDEVAMKDVNNDGMLDIAVFSRNRFTTAVYLGNGDGSFRHHTQFSPQILDDSVVKDIIIEDIDGDGHQDIVQLGEELALVRFNNGSGQFGGTRSTYGIEVSYSTGAYYTNGAVGDIDGDGDLDIVGPRGPAMFNGTSQNQYFEDFEADPLIQFTLSHPDSISVVDHNDGQRLQVDGTNPRGLRTGLVDIDYTLPDVFEMSTVVMAIPGPNHWHTGFLIFDYVNKSNFKYAGMFAGQNQWVIGHYQGDFSNRTVQVDWDDVGRTINPEQDYKLHVHLEGHEVYLTVNGEFIAHAAFANSITGGKVGLASLNGVSLFDDFQIDQYLSDGTYYDVPLHETFEDNVADKMVLNFPDRWDFVDNGPGNRSLAFNGTNYPHLGTAVLEQSLNVPYRKEMSVEMTPLAKEGNQTGGYLIYDYSNNDQFNYVHISVDENNVTFGAYRDGEFFPEPYSTYPLSNSGLVLEAGQSYLVKLRFDASYLSMSIDGIPVFNRFIRNSLNDSPQIGVGAYDSITLYDDLRVGKDLPQGGLELPILVDFEDGTTGPFQGFDDPGTAVIEQGTGKLLRINSTQDSQRLRPSLGILYPDIPNDRKYQVSADIRSNSISEAMKNGFIIFDYKSQSDFKYAGFFAGQNQWIIGHFRDNWSYRFAEVDWDDHGRKINTAQWYSLQVTFDGSLVSLTVDGEHIATTDFFTPIHEGGIGMGAVDALTWFDNFTITVPTSSIATSEPVFANWDDEADDLLI